MRNDKIQNEIIEEFSLYDEWLDKYEYIISLSEDLPAIDPQKRTDKYKIEGCQSSVWVPHRLFNSLVTEVQDISNHIQQSINICLFFDAEKSIFNFFLILENIFIYFVTSLPWLNCRGD